MQSEHPLQSSNQETLKNNRPASESTDDLARDYREWLESKGDEIQDPKSSERGYDLLGRKA